MIVTNPLCFFLAQRVYVTQGPNDVRHCDGYDKAEPFRFLIHGVVDGFSSKALWLAVVKSDNNPIIPAALYLREVKEHGVCPILLKTDCRSENVDMARLQYYSAKYFFSHKYGTSL